MTVFKENTRAEVIWDCAEGLHRVWVAGELVVETRVESLARAMFDEAVYERDPARLLRERERGAKAFESARWEGFGVRSTKNKRAGGKGGRGGV